jgi:tRNA (Thr-GGU) A37 N-methylase
MNTSLIKIGEILTPYKNLEDCPNNVSESAPDSILKLLPEFEADFLV